MGWAGCCFTVISGICAALFLPLAERRQEQAHIPNLLIRSNWSGRARAQRYTNLKARNCRGSRKGAEVIIELDAKSVAVPHPAEVPRVAVEFSLNVSLFTMAVPVVLLTTFTPK